LDKNGMNNVNHSDQEKSKQWIKLLTLIAIAVAFLFLIVLVRQHNKPKLIKTKEPTKFVGALNHIKDEKSILENAQKRALDAENKAKEIEQKFEEAMVKQREILEKMSEKMSLLESNMQRSKEVVIANANDPFANREYSGVFINHTMRRDRLNLIKSENGEKRKPIKNPDTYVPAGSFVKAVMLGGADTSTAANAQNNPEPMLFRILEAGTLPNGKKSHLKDCLVLAKVFGDISSERGEIRTRSISCVRPNDEVVDQRIEGYVFGPEGKYGVRGNPIWREGSLLQRAFLAGTLSGFGEGLQNKYTTTSISPLGATQTVNNSDIFKYGLAAGGSNAMDKLAEYNIRRAELYHPVIQISAGTVVDIVFKDGFFLDGKKHDEKEEHQQKIEYQRAAFIEQQPFNEATLSQQHVDQLKQQSMSLSTQLKNTKWSEG
jgi:membrane-associated HD superfamily phosphohydrolase